MKYWKNDFKVIMNRNFHNVFSRCEITFFTISIPPSWVNDALFERPSWSPNFSKMNTHFIVVLKILSICSCWKDVAYQNPQRNVIKILSYALWRRICQSRWFYFARIHFLQNNQEVRIEKRVILSVSFNKM